MTSFLILPSAFKLVVDGIQLYCAFTGGHADAYIMLIQCEHTMFHIVDAC